MIQLVIDVNPIFIKLANDLDCYLLLCFAKRVLTAALVTAMENVNYIDF